MSVVACKHCGEKVFFWEESKFWSHASGVNVGLVNCHGVHAPALGVINPGPFAEPAAPLPLEAVDGK